MALHAIIIASIAQKTKSWPKFEHSSAEGNLPLG